MHSRMAGFAAQSTLRSKWGDLVETGTSNLPETTEVSKGIKNVVGWLKQVNISIFIVYSLLYPIHCPLLMLFIFFFMFIITRIITECL